MARRAAPGAKAPPATMGEKQAVPPKSRIEIIEAAPFVPLDEVLGVIAYGQPAAFAKAADLQAAILKRWRILQEEDKPVRRHSLVLCLRERLVLPWLRRKRWRWRPEIQRDVRRLVRSLWHNEGKPSSRRMLSDLQADLRRDRQNWADYEAAATFLINAVVDGRCVAFGRRGYARSESFVSTTHEIIPKEVFANSFRSSLWRGWATIYGSRANADDLPGKNETEFGDIKITRADLDRLLLEVRSARLTVEADPAAASTEPSGGSQSAAFARRRPQGTDYRTSDSSLVQEGLREIAAGKFKNATDAGRQLAQRAEGHGTEASRATRLAKQIKARLLAD